MNRSREILPVWQPCRFAQTDAGARVDGDPTMLTQAGKLSVELGDAGVSPTELAGAPSNRRRRSDASDSDDSEGAEP